MTLADQATSREQGEVSSGGPERPDGSGGPARPKRRGFTAAYKARILAAYDELPDGSSERGALLRRERLYHSHLEHWRAQQEKGTLPATTGKSVRDPERQELSQLRAENKKLKARNERLTDRLGRAQTALNIAGKAFALLQDISSSADIEENRTL